MQVGDSSRFDVMTSELVVDFQNARHVDSVGRVGADEKESPIGSSIALVYHICDGVDFGAAEPFTGIETGELECNVLPLCKPPPTSSCEKKVLLRLSL